MNACVRPCHDILLNCGVLRLNWLFPRPARKLSQKMPWSSTCVTCFLIARAKSFSGGIELSFARLRLVSGFSRSQHGSFIVVSCHTGYGVFR
jgi:hypothetical protein